MSTRPVGWGRAAGGQGGSRRPQPAGGVNKGRGGRQCWTRSGPLSWPVLAPHTPHKPRPGALGGEGLTGDPSPLLPHTRSRAPALPLGTLSSPWVPSVRVAGAPGRAPGGRAQTPMHTLVWVRRQAGAGDLRGSGLHLSPGPTRIPPPPPPRSTGAASASCRPGWRTATPWTSGGTPGSWGGSRTTSPPR